MTRTRSELSRVLVALSLVIASTANRSARADETATPGGETPENDQRILLDADAIEGLDPRALRASIAAELEVDVALTAPGVKGRGTVSVKPQGPKRVVVSFVTPQKVVVRVVDLPAKSEQALEVVTLIVGNLVRDEAGGLIDALKKAKAKPPAPETLPPPIATAPPLLEPPERAKPFECAADAPIGGEFVPGVGSSTTRRGRSAVRAVSLAGIGSLSAGLHGFELAAGFTLKTRFACGVQIAGAFNWVSGPVKGVQVSGGLNAASDLRGVQVSSVNVAGVVTGAQIAAVNVATGDVHGAQIGAVNVANGDATVQVGVVNVARDGAAPIGLVSIYAKGTTHVSALGHDTGIGLVELLHGGRVIHNLYGVGGRIGAQGGRFVLSAGLGARLLGRERKAFTIDLDALCLWIRRDFAQYATLQPTLRLLFGVELTRGLALVAGPTYSVMVTNDPEEAPQSAIGAESFGTSADGWSTRAWPGFTLGLRIL